MSQFSTAVPALGLVRFSCAMQGTLHIVLQFYDLKSLKLISLILLKSPKIEFLGTMIGNPLYNLVVGVKGGTISPNKKGPCSFWMFSNLENSSV